MPSSRISRRRESRRSKCCASRPSTALRRWWVRTSSWAAWSQRKLADIVLLEGNPLDNIANTLTIWRVVAGGRVFAEPQPLTAADEEGHDPAEVH